jgi:hypothetical protein
MPGMAPIRDWWDNFWDKAKHSPTILPTRHSIPSEHVDKQIGGAFKRDQHYFSITVNRTFLKYDQQFWATFAPMALAVSEFQYDGKDTVVPFVVGPSLLEKDRIELPKKGFMFLDTMVAGPHPYKGGGLKLTLILYRVKRTDLVRKLLKVIENVASALDLSQTLAAYLKLANVLVNTVEDVLGLDSDNQPIVGLRQEFAAGDFKPGYYTLIDDDKIDPSKLWVRDNDLLYGEAPNPSKFADSNFVLYSIRQTIERDDYEALSPIGEMWKQVRREATLTKDGAWENAKAAMSTLYQAMVLSPDLTEDHANRLDDDFVARMRRMHERALENVSHGEASEEIDPFDKVRRKALDILKLQ